MHEASQVEIAQLIKTMQVGDYAPSSIKNYVRELRFISEYYPTKPLSELTSTEIEDYILYLKTTLGSGRDKCRMTAHSLSFFFKHVAKKPYSLPSKFYPKKAFKLPNVMTESEVKQLIDSCENLKQLAFVSVFYSTGVRLEECTKLLISDINSTEMYIHLRAGKGKKDRRLLLSSTCLATLRKYYIQYKPKVYLFEGMQEGKAIHPRAAQWHLYRALEAAKLKDKGYSAHTMRHSFATHMLDHGTDLHTIKELLGHSKIETTMVYLHLQSKKRMGLVSPLDVLYNQNDLDRVPLDEKNI